MYLSQFWRPEVQNQGVGMTGFLLGTLRVGPLHVSHQRLEAPGNLWHSWARTCITPPPSSHGLLPGSWGPLLL